MKHYIKQKNLVRNKIMGLTGMTDEFFCMYISEFYKENPQNILIVTSSLFEANSLYTSLINYNENVYLFPMDDFLTSESIAISPDLKISRLETLNQTISHETSIVITHLNGYLRFLPTKKNYRQNIVKITTGEEYPREILVKNLSKIGYQRETTVTKTGEMGIRGFIVDVFPINSEHPIRIEYFDEEIESIRYFDEETQSSIAEIKEVAIHPITEFILSKEIDGIGDNQKYLAEYEKDITNISGYLEECLHIFKDYSQIKMNYFHLQEEIMEYKNNKNNYQGKYMYHLDDLIPKYQWYYSSINNMIEEVERNNLCNFFVTEPPVLSENIELINKYLREMLEIGKTIIIFLKDYQSKNFIKYLENKYVLTNLENIEKNTINIIHAKRNKGYCYENLIVLTEKELFNVTINKQKYKTKFKYASKIKDLKHLEVGDYVVHNIHGIGVYNGIKTLKQGEYLKDYLEILYNGKDKLYIPVEKIDLISKYNGKEGSVPKVNKLGGTEWQKTKQRIKNKVKGIAQKLINLYAAREMKQGISFSKDDELQLLFEEEFEHIPTKDQLLAIQQIKEDMESTHPMDRLLCGDVGYGKTEVAFRAMFKAAKDGMQVLYLCPTTILAQQQFENAKNRFKNFPINIEILNRFTSARDSNRIIRELADGKVDILIGTHRILSDDIKPKKLGLLIIDEEQRFGVIHKEKIKEFKKNIDVLTLTATPIPRTLQMSMAGIRSLSLIETAPVNRYPVQTYVIEENKAIIKDAIYKELSRNGQVFLLYNSVETIEKKVAEISRLVPEARIIFAHGKLTKNDLENRMIDFINHEYDVLICTTIIETGIDIPNVNTLIILDANHFGLSQLYQIRGRVGRSDKIAFAYLMYKPDRMLTETAIKRLNVIKEFTELGSGFAIATRDLSIRGAGDILGSEQAGFIDNVGIELYMKILDEEVKRLKGEKIEEESSKDEKPLLNVETHIEDNYVEENDLKIEIHKKINAIDSYEKLIEVKQELEDRFGKVNEKLLIYMYEEWFEKLAKKLEIIKVVQNKNSIELFISPEMSKKIDGEKLFYDSFNISKMFRFKFLHQSLIIILDTIKLEKHYIYLLVELLSKITPRLD